MLVAALTAVPEAGPAFSHQLLTPRLRGREHRSLGISDKDQEAESKSQRPGAATGTPSGSQSVAPRPASSASPGNLPRMPILDPT